MGYSCTKAADDTFNTISRDFAKDGNPNVLFFQGKDYFFERGRENEDGAITGKLMVMLPDDYCQSVGSVRIEPDGKVKRFPVFRALLKDELLAR